MKQGAEVVYILNESVNFVKLFIKYKDHCSAAISFSWRCFCFLFFKQINGLFLVWLGFFITFLDNFSFSVLFINSLYELLECLLNIGACFG